MPLYSDVPAAVAGPISMWQTGSCTVVVIVFSLFNIVIRLNSRAAIVATIMLQSHIKIGPTAIESAYL